MPDVALPGSSVEDLLRMLGERDVRIDQLTRRVLELQAQLAATTTPVPSEPTPCERATAES